MRPWRHDGLIASIGLGTSWQTYWRRGPVAFGISAVGPTTQRRAWSVRGFAVDRDGRALWPSDNGSLAWSMDEWICDVQDERVTLEGTRPPLGALLRAAPGRGARMLARAARPGLGVDVVLSSDWPPNWLDVVEITEPGAVVATASGETFFVVERPGYSRLPPYMVGVGRATRSECGEWLRADGHVRRVPVDEWIDECDGGHLVTAGTPWGPWVDERHPCPTCGIVVQGAGCPVCDA